jgi:hypothetical protein
VGDSGRSGEDNSCGRRARRSVVPTVAPRRRTKDGGGCSQAATARAAGAARAINSESPARSARRTDRGSRPWPARDSVVLLRRLRLRRQTPSDAVSVEASVRDTRITRLGNICRSHSTNDPGMKDMWRFLIARDTMHQQQWLAVLEELDDPANAPGDFEERGRVRRHRLRVLQPRRRRTAVRCSLDDRPFDRRQGHVPRRRPALDQRTMPGAAADPTRHAPQPRSDHGQRRQRRIPRSARPAARDVQGLKTTDVREPPEASAGSPRRRASL